MKHVITILDIKHLSKDGEILWEAKDLFNTLHVVGEEYILKAVFTGGVTNTYIPASYYFGLDNRATIAPADTMTTVSLNGEPSTSGYARASISSTGQFAVSISGSGNNVATSPVVSFTASGGSFGPVRNMFLTDQTDNSGYLIASVPLTSQLTVSAGETIAARMGLVLKDCP